MIKFEYTLQIEPAQIGKALIDAKDFQQNIALEAMVKEVENIGHDEWVIRCRRIRDGFIILGKDKDRISIAQKEADDLRHKMVSMLEVLVEHLRKE